MRILLAEDNELLGKGLKRALLREAYQVDWFLDGRQALHALQIDEFSLAVLDLNLPSMDGLEIISQLRRQKNNIPILILTARDTLSDRIKGLDVGADDYLVKPFAIRELLARIRALSRRHYNIVDPHIKIGRVRVNPSNQDVFLDDEAVTLSRREFAVLMEFVNHNKQILTRHKLEDILYGWDGEIESNAIEVHIHHLRKKLYPQLITTLRGVGYRLNTH
jgi:two-component system response regulator QseB